ncbi:hypothetical protein B0H66DRAFT_603528 [Apodospora peruviana]|uniref:Uncharacterized protein n=1 Tax=Apodospora peruviana TaxID=516989 RepID=A0AAE0I5N6_9PEZI|nr:hypothetical protein B0H66DRAFT_603528 [Apodospora peruviana]
MAKRSQPAALSVLQPRTINVFSGLWQALRQREVLAGVMAFVGVLSKFLPVLLSGVPFTAAQTWMAHEICTWGSVALLIVMIATLLGHAILVKWPHLPAASPDSLACCIYYVCDSAMLRDFEGLSMLGMAQRDRRVERMGRMYRFGWMTGVSGETRVGMDYPEGGQGFKLQSLGALGLGRR